MPSGIGMSELGVPGKRREEPRESRVEKLALALGENHCAEDPLKGRHRAMCRSRVRWKEPEEPLRALRPCCWTTATLWRSSGEWRLPEHAQGAAMDRGILALCGEYV